METGRGDKRRENWERSWASLTRTAKAKKGAPPLPSLAATLGPIDEIGFLPPLPNQPEVWFSVFPPDIDTIGQVAGEAMAMGCEPLRAFREALPEIAERLTTIPVGKAYGLRRHAADDLGSRLPITSPQHPLFRSYAASIPIACMYLPDEWWLGDEPAEPVVTPIAAAMGIGEPTRTLWIAAASARFVAMRDKDKQFRSDTRDWAPKKLTSEAERHAEVDRFLKALAAGENPPTPEHLLQQPSPATDAAATPPAARPSMGPKVRVAPVPAFRRR